MKFLVVNGPNINMTGIREQGVYGARNYAEITAMIQAEAKRREIEIEVVQSNIEGEMINAIQRCYFENMDGLIINPGAYTHTSYALHDAIKSIAPIPAVEVHLSNVHARERFRHESKTAPACLGQLCGFGDYGYVMAMDALIQHLSSKH